MNTTTVSNHQVGESAGLQAVRQAPSVKSAYKAIFIFGWLLLLISILAAAGLGTWSYQLRTRLAAAESQLVSVQGDYGKLKADHAKLTADLSQANSTIDQITSDLGKTNADLKAVQGEVAAERAKLDAARKLMAVLEAASSNNPDPAEVNAQVFNAGDARLASLWNAVVRMPSDENALAFAEYLWETMRNALK